MAGHDIVVIGASAGGVEALRQVVHEFPSDLPAAVFVVLHVPPLAPSVLPRILSRAGPLPASQAQDGEAITPGRIYVAPPDRHLLLRDGRVCLSLGPKENGHRPAVDPLFRSAAVAHGPRVIGVILTGALDDGTAGLLAVKQRGGIAIVQDPTDALYPGMPNSALAHVPVDQVVGLAGMSQAIVGAVNSPLSEPPPDPPDELQMEVDMAEVDASPAGDPSDVHPPSAYTCPECHGSLFEIRDGRLVRFRCRVGHAYSPDTLLAKQSGAVEAALWSALRALEEQAALTRRLQRDMGARGHPKSEAYFRTQTESAERHLETLRKLLLDTGGRPEERPA
jgi:two-component system chemotaxis response regulator CheB